MIFGLRLAIAKVPLPHVPRLSAKAAMTLVKQGVKYVIIDSATFGSEDVCGAIFISYSWVPPWTKKPRIKVKIPKDYYIFVYCT